MVMAPFMDQMRYPTGSYPQLVVVGDVNSDKRLDIVVANSVDNNVGVLLGYGNGLFADQVTQPTGFDPVSVAVSDLNKRCSSGYRLLPIGIL